MSGNMQWPGTPIQAAPAARQQWPGTPVAAQVDEAIPPPPPQAPPVPRGLAVNAAAGTNDAATSFLGLPVDLATAGINAVGSGVNYLAGREVVPRIQNPIGGTQSIRDALGTVGASPDQVVPANEGERLVRATTRGGTEAALMLTGAGALQAGTRAGSALNTAAGTLAAQPGLQVASGVASGAVGEATDSPLAGLAAGVAVPLAAAGAARVASPFQGAVSPERQRLLGVARQEGIPITAGQATGSRFLRNVESQFEQLPLSAGPQTARREAQHQAYIAAAWRRAGETATDTTPATINAARSRIGGEIGAIAARNTLTVDPQLAQASAQLRQNLQFLEPGVARAVEGRINDIATRFQNGRMPGTTYRQIDSDLGRQIRGTGNPDLRNALIEVREALRRGMDRSISPQDAGDWATARRQYANLQVIARAAGRAGEGAAEGRMSPLALREAVDQSTGGGYAFGRGDLNDLARLGQGPLRPPPDSGTAGREQVNRFLTGRWLAGAGGAAGFTVGGLPGAAVGAAVGVGLPRTAQAVYNNPLVQAYLMNQRAAGYRPMNALVGIGATQAAGAMQGQ